MPNLNKYSTHLIFHWSLFFCAQLIYAERFAGLSMENFENCLIHIRTLYNTSLSVEITESLLQLNKKLVKTVSKSIESDIIQPIHQWHNNYCTLNVIINPDLNACLLYTSEAADDLTR